jgi:peroxiredoxin-like protein
MAQHSWYLEANWNGDRLGSGTMNAGNLKSEISVPSALGGPGIGTNPEEMLVGAAATCYLITLAAVLSNRKLPVAELTLKSEIVVENEPAMKVEKIIHRPQIVLAADATDEQLDTADKAAHRADKACMISKALDGNVEVSVEAVVTRAVTKVLPPQA